MTRSTPLSAARLLLLVGLLISLALPAAPVKASGGSPQAETPGDPVQQPDTIERSNSSDLLSAALSPEADSLFNRNLIVNGNAEMPVTGIDLPGWLQWDDSVIASPYSPDSLLTPTDLGPIDRGSSFFSPDPIECEPPGSTSRCNVAVAQRIPLTGLETQIDAGGVRFTLSGYLGGIADEDTAILSIESLDSERKSISGGGAAIGPTTASERRFKAGMVFHTISGTLPKGTRSIWVNLSLLYYQRDGMYSPTGVADNLSLVLSGPRVFLPMSVSGGIPAPITKPSLPVAPSSLTSTPIGVTGLSLTWKDNAANETGYRIERQAGGEPAHQPVAYLPAGQTSYTDTGLAPGTPVSYRVIAFNQAGDSIFASLSTSLPPNPVTPPNPPASCWISNLSSTSVVFSWTDSSNNETSFPLWIAQDGINSNQYRYLADMQADATSVTIIDLLPGVDTALSISAKNSAGESQDCWVNFIPPAQTGGLKIINNASYPVAYLTINGVQEFPASPMGILVGSYYEVPLNPGTYEIEARTGFWQDQTHRFDMYTHRYTVTVTAGQVNNLQVNDISIENLLTQFNTTAGGYGYWEGTYWENLTCRTAAFRFYPNKTYKYFVSNREQGSGTYTLVGRKPSIFASTFSVSGLSGKEALLLELYGYFYLKNGPPGWEQIEYHYKPNGYVANPFCP